IGFSTALLIFHPNKGMSFDEYFDLNDHQQKQEQILNFALGLTPKALQLPYMDLSRVSLSREYGPSIHSACLLCAGFLSTEALKILLNRGKSYAAPHYFQMDPYRMLYKHGVLRWGNKNPWQKFKK